MSVVLRAGLWLIVTLLGTLIQASHSAKAACPPGYGSKPTPGGFGGWSCQPLGGGVPSGGGYRGAGGSTGGGSSGGGNNVGAAIGAAGIAIEILGAMADEAAQQEAAQQAADAATQAEAARRAAARQAYCLDNWRRAVVMIEQGRLRMLELQPEASIGFFESAIQALSHCRDSKNIALIQRNLDTVRRHAAAQRDDNRVGDAQRRYAANDANRGPNPFDGARQPASARISLTADPRDIVRHAEKACGYMPAGMSQRRQCMATEEARQIMASEADIQAACGWIGDPAKRSKCALDAFVAKLNVAAKDPGNCYFKSNGSPCFPGGSASPAPQPKAAESVRDALKRKLAEAARASGRTTTITDAEVDAAVAAESRRTEPPVVIATSSRPDDPLGDYLRARQGRLDANNAGRLDPSKGDMTGIEPSAAQRRQQDDLLRPQMTGEVYGPPLPPDYKPPAVP